MNQPTAQPRVFTWQVVAALGAVYLIWGSTYLAITFLLKGLPPLLAASARHSAAGAVLLVWSMTRGAPWPTRPQWKNALVVAFLLQGCGNAGVVLAQQTVSSSLASVLVSIMPLWAAVFAGLWGQWPKRLDMAALGLGALGVVVLSVRGELSGQPGSVALLVGSSAAWGLGSVWSRHMDLPKGTMAAATQMLGGGFWVVLMALARGESVPTGPIPSSALWAWVYLAVMGSLVAYSAYMFLLQNVRPALATSYAYVNPVVATLLGITWGGESWSVWSVAGSGLVLSGVVLLMWKKG